MGVTLLGAESFGIFRARECNASKAFETGLGQIIATEVAFFDLFLSLWEANAATVGQATTLAIVAIGVLGFALVGVTLFGADRAVGRVAEANTDQILFAAFLGILSTHLVDVKDGVATGDTDTTGGAAIAVGQSGTTSRSTTSVMNPSA